MVTMFRGPRWKIAVYGRDHGVPHFHIEGPDFRCSVAIASFDVIVGTVSAAVLKDALEWARPNQALLMQTWQELNGCTSPTRPAPLPPCARTGRHRCLCPGRKGRPLLSILARDRQHVGQGKKWAVRGALGCRRIFSKKHTHKINQHL